MSLADAHLDGLSALLETKPKRRGAEQSLDNELADRYIVL